MQKVEQFKKEVGDRIKEAREWNNFTQVFVAKKLGISRQTYLDLESGKTEPKLLVILSLCQVLGRPISYFVGYNTNKNPLSVYNTDDLLKEIRSRIKD